MVISSDTEAGRETRACTLGSAPRGLDGQGSCSEFPALGLGGATEDARVQALGQGELQAVLLDRAGLADGLGLGDLAGAGADLRHREEQLRLQLTAGGEDDPIRKGE